MQQRLRLHASLLDIAHVPCHRTMQTAYLRSDYDRVQLQGGGVQLARLRVVVIHEALVTLTGQKRK